MSVQASQKSLFTDNLPSDLQDTVRRIADGGATKFRSNPTTYDENGKGWVNYDLAWKSGQTGLWTLESYKSFLEDGKLSASQKKTVARNVCFFDALYHCAHSEKSRLSGGQARFDDGDDRPHFSAVAQTAKQPLDQSGIPHPAAEGNILTDGLFTQDQLEIAEKTESLPLAVPTANQKTLLSHRLEETLSGIDIDTAAHKDSALTTLTVFAKRKLEKEQFEKVLKDVDHAVSKTVAKTGIIDGANAVKEMFLDDFMLGILIPMTAVMGAVMVGMMGGLAIGGAASALTGIAGIAETMFVGGMVAGPLSIPFLTSAIDKGSEMMRNRKLKKLDKIIAQTPDSNLKTAMQEFRLTAEANSYFIRAARTIEKYGYSSKRHLKNVFADVTKGADLLGLSDIDKSKLESAILKEDFPGYKYFINDLDQRVASLRRVFDKDHDRIFDAAQAPMIEHKPEITLDEMGLEAREKVPQPK